MFTTINEMLFSKHYVNDGSETRLNRLRNIKINNNLEKPELAKDRLKHVILKLAVEKLDKITNSKYVTYYIPKIIFIENGSEKVANLTDSDGNTGNSISFICDNKVITTYISRTNNIEEIMEISDQHAKRHGINKKCEGVYSLISNKKLTNKHKETLKIDLDMGQLEFYKEWTPFSSSSSNIMMALNKNEVDYLKDKMAEYAKLIKDNKMTTNISLHKLPNDFEIESKEFVIYAKKETQYYLYINNEIKYLPVTEVERVPYRDKYNYFIHTYKGSIELKIGDKFIIQPQMNSETTLKLKKQFNIDSKDKVYFSGRITDITYYNKKGEPEKIGVHIKPIDVLEFN